MRQKMSKSKKNVLAICEDVMELREYQSDKVLRTFRQGDTSFKKSLITHLDAKVTHLDAENRVALDTHPSSFLNGKGEPLSTNIPFGYDIRQKIISAYKEEIIPKYKSLMDKVA